MKSNGNTHYVGFGLFTLSIMVAFFLFGVFYDNMVVMNLLYVMYILGLFTILGMELMCHKEKKRKYVQKKKEKA